MIGPGKYDYLCTLVREREHADAAIVIIVNGSLGSGFSVQAQETALSSNELANILDIMARQLRLGAV